MVRLDLKFHTQVPGPVIAHGPKVVVLEVVAGVRDEQREVSCVVDVDAELVLDEVRHLAFEEEARPRHDEARFELAIARRRRLPPDQVVAKLGVGSDVQAKLLVSALDEEPVEVPFVETGDVVLNLRLFGIDFHIGRGLGHDLGGRRFGRFFRMEQRPSRGGELRGRGNLHPKGSREERDAERATDGCCSHHCLVMRFSSGSSEVALAFAPIGGPAERVKQRCFCAKSSFRYRLRRLSSARHFVTAGLEGAPPYELTGYSCRSCRPS